MFRVNHDSDFYAGTIKGDGISNLECVTTDINNLHVSPGETMTHVAKADVLYYWSTKDNNHPINQICDNFSEDADLYLTDHEDIIFYVTDKQEIPDSNHDMGTLLWYSMSKMARMAVHFIRYVPYRKIRSTYSFLK